MWNNKIQKGLNVHIKSSEISIITYSHITSQGPVLSKVQFKAISMNSKVPEEVRDTCQLDGVPFGLGEGSPYNNRTGV